MRPPTFEPTSMLRASSVPAPVNPLPLRLNHEAAAIPTIIATTSTEMTMVFRFIKNSLPPIHSRRTRCCAIPEDHQQTIDPFVEIVVLASDRPHHFCAED